MEQGKIWAIMIMTYQTNPLSYFHQSKRIMEMKEIFDPEISRKGKGRKILNLAYTWAFLPWWVKPTKNQTSLNQARLTYTHQFNSKSHNHGKNHIRSAKFNRKKKMPNWSDDSNRNAMLKSTQKLQKESKTNPPEAFEWTSRTTENFEKSPQGFESIWVLKKLVRCEGEASERKMREGERNAYLENFFFF